MNALSKCIFCIISVVRPNESNKNVVSNDQVHGPSSTSSLASYNRVAMEACAKRHPRS